MYLRGASGGIIITDIKKTESHLKMVSEIIDLVRGNAGDIPILLAIPISLKGIEIPSGRRRFEYKAGRYTFTEITEDVGSSGEQAFEYLAKKMIACRS